MMWIRFCCRSSSGAPPPLGSTLVDDVLVLPLDHGLLLDDDLLLDKSARRHGWDHLLLDEGAGWHGWDGALLLEHSVDRVAGAFPWLSSSLLRGCGTDDIRSAAAARPSGDRAKQSAASSAVAKHPRGNLLPPRHTAAW